jgi:flagellar biosynthesis/type III secretory pathway protein FliH
MLAQPPVTAPPEAASAIVEEVDESDDALTDLLRDIRLFHAAVMEGVEDAIEIILADIASDVLGRELQLAPVDLAMIVHRMVQRYLADEPVCFRVHPSEAAALACDVPVVCDERLRTGDCVLELRSGHVDASLGIRLAAVTQASCK